MHDYSPFWASLRIPIKGKKKRIGFWDSSDPRVLQAASFIDDNQLFTPILLKESLNQCCQLLNEKKLDGLVCGANCPTAEVVRTALKTVGARPGMKFVGGHFFIESPIRQSHDITPLLLADCAVVPEPGAHTLALLAKGACESFQFFTGKPPKVAFLSFSTRDSAQHPLVERIKEAVSYFKNECPDIIVDGEIQVDAALDTAVAKIKGAEDSPVAGQANVLIFPTLEAGNIAYKLIQRFTEVKIAGPLLWGLKRPVSDLSRGCTVDEIVDTALCVAKWAERTS